MTKLIKFITLGVLLATAATVGWRVYQSYQTQISWKGYSSTVYNYTVSYPSNWALEPGGGSTADPAAAPAVNFIRTDGIAATGGAAVPRAVISITRYPNPQGYSVQDWYNSDYSSYSGQSPIAKAQITSVAVLDREAILVTPGQDTAAKAEYYFIDDGNFVLSIFAKEDEDDAAPFPKDILSIMAGSLRFK